MSKNQCTGAAAQGEWSAVLDTRCEVQLNLGQILCYALRRQDPSNHPLLASIPYQYPNKPFRSKK